MNKNTNLKKALHPIIVQKKLKTIYGLQTKEEKQQLPTGTEVPSQNTLIRTDTDLKNGTNVKSSGQDLQAEDEMVIDVTMS